MYHGQVSACRLRTETCDAPSSPTADSRCTKFGSAEFASRCALLALAWLWLLAMQTHAGDLVERGIYLARAGNCISCHTTLEGEPYAGGVVFPTPFGSIYSTNITSDPDTGIGKWTLAQFTAALRQGVRPNGEHLYPAFPYTAFTKLSDADVAALYAYFKTVPAVASEPRANDMIFPFGARRLMRIWKAMFFQEGRFRSDAAKSVQWNRGAYLVEALGHCSACHSPRNLLGAEVKNDSAFSGGAYHDLDEDGRQVERASANLTPAADGLAAWSAHDIADYLKTGASSRTRVTGAMNAVVLNSTRHLTSEDTDAIAMFIKSLPPHPAAAPVRPRTELMQAGALQFDIHCGTCHLPTGLGSANTAPPLVGSAIALTANPASFVSLVLYAPRLPVEAPSINGAARPGSRCPLSISG